MDVSPEDIQRIVVRVLENMGHQAAPGTGGSRPGSDSHESEFWGGKDGLFPTVDDAVRAARHSFEQLHGMSLEKRRRIIERMRLRFSENIHRFSRHAVQETGLGRVEDKMVKNRLAVNKTPGVEDIEPRVFSGDDGLTLLERRPWGVIASVTPTTNSTETVVCNAIGMVAGGNSVVFNPHPRAKRVSQAAISVLNRAVVEAGGPPHLLTAAIEPTLETTGEALNHPDVNMVVVTGGGEVVKAAFRTGKKAITAGPGNPPVVVDETADIAAAARHIVNGASLDNNILCIAEKEIIVVESVADQLVEALKQSGGYQVVGTVRERLEKLIFPEKGKLNRDLIGQDVQVILAKVGLNVDPSYRMAFVEVEADHPFVFYEMLMPVLPLVRVRDVHAAIELAKKAEKGFGHTAVMHSKNLDNLHKMAREIGTSIFVKNGPSYAGLGEGGEGFTSFSIAHPTGEGLTTARHFTKEIRCVLKGYFHIV